MVGRGIRITWIGWIAGVMDDDGEQGLFGDILTDLKLLLVGAH